MSLSNLYFIVSILQGSADTSSKVDFTGQIALPESSTADLSNVNQSLLQLTLSDKDFQVPKRKGGGCKGGVRQSGQGTRAASRQGQVPPGMTGKSLPPVSDSDGTKSQRQVINNT